jgi:hypothetical protein
VVRHRLQCLPMLSWVVQDLVAGHNASIDFIQDDLSAKFD